MATARGLSGTDVTFIRDMLASGRKPKVVFTEAAGQVVGKTGQVIELTDPKASEEWIVVRFGRDELPFAPTDLAIPPKSPPAKRADVKAEAPAPPLLLNERPAPPASTKATASSPVPTPREESRMPVPSATTPTNGAEPNPNGGSNGASGAKPAKAVKAKPLPSLTVTLAYTDREWTITASQGTKVLAKPYLIKPTEALRMVALIDVPGVHEAVESIIESERSEAEGKALRLREELAEIENRLAELTSRE
jgi:hypothetical protein